MSRFDLETSKAESYEEFPYPSYAYSQTHPDKLAALAVLSGIQPADVTGCRVLELGCASGGNLVPIAYTLPGSEFLGLDFSGPAIEEGQALIASLGLENVRLEHGDIRHLDRSLGLFDYIIVHGIYSWVSPEIQDHILRICRQNLAPNGVAYISYNSYPGWNTYRTVREIMVYHTRNITDPRERVSEARRLLEYMGRELPAADNQHGYFLRSIYELLESTENGYLRHDFMADINAPCYFYEFVDHARRHGLQYMANADMHTGIRLHPRVMAKVLTMTDDPIETEQYLDFMKNRTFRQTLLCHQELPVSRSLTADSLTDLRLSTRIFPEFVALNLRSDDEDDFRTSDGRGLSIGHRLTKAALVRLVSIAPRTIPYHTLLEEAWSLLANYVQLDPDSRDDEHRLLALNILSLYEDAPELVSFHTYQPAFVSEISDKPLASPIARYQAERRLPIANMYFERIGIEEIPRQLLAYLDGTRNQVELLAILIESAAQGILEVSQDGQPVNDPEIARPLLIDILGNILHNMARSAVLVG